MALVSTITCKACGERKQIWHSPADGPPDICGECLQREADADKRAELDALAALSGEERLSKIEEWIYDHRRKYHAPFPARF